MITCHLRYVLDPFQLPAFEQYSRDWMRMVRRMGGDHHGYFMPSEGANNIAYALFSFPSLADYERYRREAEHDEEAKGVMARANDLKFILSYERTFVRPMFE